MELRARTRPAAAAHDGSQSHSSASPFAPPPSSDPNSAKKAQPAPVSLASMFYFLLAFRLVNAVAIRTFFQPDEHYQTTEIAHRMVFGYGFKSWEWSPSYSTGAALKGAYLAAAVQNLLNGPVRSILHPLLFVPGYAVLKLTGLDATYLLILFPRLQQAVVAAAGDWYTFRLAQRIGGPVVGWFALLVSLTNLYSVFTATRTFSNSTEAAFTAAALFYWPYVPLSSLRFDVASFSTREERQELMQLQGPGCGWRQMAPSEAGYGWQDGMPSDDSLSRKQVAGLVYDRTLRKSVVLAAAACLLRPTNGVLWMYLAAELLVRQVQILRSHPSVSIPSMNGGGGKRSNMIDRPEGSMLPLLEFVGEASSLVGTLAVIGVAAVATAIGIDTAYDYFANQAGGGGKVLPALSVVSFVHKNVVANLSIFYGANPWHWYLTQGLPVLCTLWLPATLYGLLAVIHEKQQGLAADARRSLARLVCVTVGVYSLLGHKEFRFLQPLLPALTVLAAAGLAESYAGTAASRQAASVLLKGQASNPLRQLWRALNLLPLWLRALLLTIQPIAAVYLTTIHAVAQEQVPFELGRIYRQQQLSPSSADQVEFGPGIGRIQNLGFLMPCHSTPWATHLHDATLVERSWFIQCPPPPSRSEMTPAQRATKYWDQSDFFYHDPIKYLVDRFPYNVDTDYPPSPEPQLDGEAGAHPWDRGWRHSWPSHLVVFESLLQEGTRRPGHTRTLKNLLSLKGYREVARYWNTPKHEDARRDGDIVVLAYKGPKSHR